MLVLVSVFRLENRRDDALEAVGLCDVTQPARAGFDGALLGRVVDADQAKGRTVAKHPLEVVQGGPVNVA